jgi:hypothetical protein
MKLITIDLPEYKIDQKPDYQLGKQVDKVIKQSFNVGSIVVRAISSTDHSEYSIDKLIKIIFETGTDKYDPIRKGVAHEEFEPYKADLQAETFEIDEKVGSFFGGVMRKFYENALIDRGYSIRIDLLLVYDISQLVQAEKIDQDKPSIESRFEKYLFRFKDPSKKAQALLGVIKIK